MTLNLLFLAIVFLVAALALYDYRKRPTRQSRLVVTILPAYEVPELIVVSGVLVENRGDASARDVKISLAYPDAIAQKIRHLQVMSDIEYSLQAGGERESFVALGVPQFNPGQKLVIYFSGSDHSPPRVTLLEGMK